MSSQKYILIVSALIAFAAAEASAFEYTSYFLTAKDIIFFAYEDGTIISLTD